jgi:hypothetical protein
MVMLDFDRIRRAATAMSDEELSEALASRREDYVPEALELMSAELERRGMNPREHVPSKEATRVILPWLTVYVALTVIAALGAILSMASTPLRFLTLFVMGFLVVAAYYLNKRASWAWWATMLFLAFAAYGAPAMIWPGGGHLLALWGIGNGIYFYRVRQHFTA